MSWRVGRSFSMNKRLGPKQLGSGTRKGDLNATRFQEAEVPLDTIERSTNLASEVS